MLGQYIIAGGRSRSIEACDEDTSNASYYYYGFITLEGSWMIMREDLTGSAGVIAYRYATAKNNSYSAYATAWTNRAALTYAYFYQAQL